MASSLNWLDDPRSQPYQADVYADAAANGLDPNVLGQQIETESGFNPNAVNAKSGATGIAQFLPSTAAQPGYGLTAFDPTDPTVSIAKAAQYDAARGTSAYSGGAYDDASLLGAANVSATPAAGSDITTSGDINAAYTGGASPGTDTDITSSGDINAAYTQGASGNASAPSTGGIGGSSWNLAQYFEAAIVVVLGIVFVAVGLTYFSHPTGGVVGAVSRSVKRGALLA